MGSRVGSSRGNSIGASVLTTNAEKADYAIDKSRNDVVIATVAVRLSLADRVTLIKVFIIYEIVWLSRDTIA